MTTACGSTISVNQLFPDGEPIEKLPAGVPSDDEEEEDESDDEEEVAPKKAKKAVKKEPKEKRANRRDPIDLSFLTSLSVGKNDNVQDLVFSDED